MKLALAVEDYIRLRRAAGSRALSSAATLKAFSRYCGDIALEEVSPHLVATYIGRPDRALTTRAGVFSALKCFLAHQHAMGRTGAYALGPPPKVLVRRPPRIYTKEEIRLLLAGTVACQATAFDCDAETLGLALLLLYATGATVSEVMQLRCSDLLLRSRIICLGRGECERRVPIPFLLAMRLEQAMRGKGPGNFLLINRFGAPLSRKYLCSRFRRLSRQVGIANDAGGRPPRLQDFRYTFAVHRIEGWIHNDANLNALLPALSTYMGYADLFKSEEFLSLAPERFRGALEKLRRPSDGSQ